MQVRCERAEAALATGLLAQAEAELTWVLERSPGHLAARLVQARWLAQSGQLELARQRCQQIVSEQPNFPAALSQLSVVSLPGPYYEAVLAQYHDWLAPKVYLEIGVEGGNTFRLTRPDCLAVGIDPSPLPAARLLGGNRRLFEEISDNFFRRRSPESVAGGKRVDFAFVDGMHHFEFAFRDLLGVERWSRAGSVAVVHDILPVHAACATRERRTDFWTGDTWKLLFVLRDLRPDLVLRIIACPPSGLLVVTGLDPESPRERDWMADKLDSYQNLDREFFCPDAWTAEFTVLPNTPAGWRDALAESLPHREPGIGRVIP